jgi:uncharacterized protein (DUF1800 family)
LATAALGGNLLAQAAPDITVSNGGNVPLGGTVVYGLTRTGTANTITFTITNSGSAPLVVGENISIVAASGPKAGNPTATCGFTLMQNITGDLANPPDPNNPGVPDTFLGSESAYTIAPGDTTIFAVALNSATSGDFSAVVSIDTNISGKNPFTFTVTGVSLEPPAVRYSDDNDATFSATSGFTAGFSQAGNSGTIPFNLTLNTAPAGTGENSATWTFSGLDPGQYRVSATWPGYSFAANDTPYTISDGSNAVATIPVDQTQDSAGFADAASNWQDLGTFTITSGTLKVQVTDSASGTVLADAVRMERVGFPGALLDDLSPQFSTTGTWTQVFDTTQMDLQTSRTIATVTKAGDPTATASWTFSVTPGTYRVVAGYHGYSGYATDAPFSVFDNTTNLTPTPVRVDQTVTPVANMVGIGFRDIGVFNITSSTLVVQLGNNATTGSTVNADAVLIERADTPTTVTQPDAIRFLEQATWGPTPFQINQVQSLGINAYLQAQFTATPSTYPTLPPYSTNNNSSVTVSGTTHGNTLYSCHSDGSTNGNNFRTACTRDNYSMYPLQTQFFTNAIYSDADQTRQRMAWALHKIWVISFGNGGEINQASWMAPYLQILTAAEDGLGNGTFGNYRNLMYNITLNAGMGHYLNMAGSRKASGSTIPNENYPREIMQLFTIGLFELNPDGSQKMDNNSQPIATYTNDKITEMARVFTGWNLSPELVLESGTSSGGNAARTFNDTSKSWKATGTGPAAPLSGQWDGLTLRIISGTGSGQTKTIFTTGTNQLTLSSNWTTIPNNTSTYRITGSLADYISPMLLNPTRAANGTVSESTTYHDFSSKNLLRNFVQPARTATVAHAYLDLNEALDNLYAQPSVAPFICQQLIQQLVTSNPSNAYVARVSDVFNRRRTDPYQLMYVTQAILTDPDARGDLKTDSGYGKLKEPVLYTNNMMRLFGAVAASGTQGTQSDGYLNPMTVGMGQDVFNPPTVFSYFAPGYVAVGGSPPLLGPEFQIQNTSTGLARVNFSNTMFTPNTSRAVDVVRARGTTPSGTDPNTGNPLVATGPNGTAVSIINSLLPYTVDAAHQAVLVNSLNTSMLHGTMSPDMTNDIIAALSAIPLSNPPTVAQQREVAHTALYLVATSSQYQVQQ